MFKLRHDSGFQPPCPLVGRVVRQTTRDMSGAHIEDMREIWNVTNDNRKGSVNRFIMHSYSEDDTCWQMLYRLSGWWWDDIT